MGNYIYTSSKPTLSLCESLIDDNDDILINIQLYTCKNPNDNDSKRILDFLQFTHPTFCYMCHNKIWLVYNQKITPSFLRSNVASSVISYLTSELTIWIIQNMSLDLCMISINISIGDYNTLLEIVNSYIVDNTLSGFTYHNDIFQIK
jgi:uncharacterized secreted protein with C-terminal beta-propeller domain